jgi:hypothetical protein
LSLIGSADELSTNDSDLRELFDIVKEAIKGHAKHNSTGEPPIELTRRNIDNQYVHISTLTIYKKSGIYTIMYILL